MRFILCKNLDQTQDQPIFNIYSLKTGDHFQL